MTDIFPVTQLAPTHIFTIQSPSSALANMRTRNRPQKVRTFQLARQQCLQDFTDSDLIVHNDDSAHSIRKVSILNKVTPPVDIAVNNYDANNEEIQPQPPRKQKKTIVRRILKIRKQSGESEAPSLQNDIESNSSNSTSTPEPRKVKRVTFAEEIESYEIPSPSKTPSRKSSMQKLSVEVLPTITIPEKNATDEILITEVVKRPESRIHARSDQTLPSTPFVEYRADSNISIRHYNLANNFEKRNPEISPLRLPIIMSPNTIRVKPKIPSAPPMMNTYSTPRLSKLSLLSPMNRSPNSERQSNENSLFKDYGLVRRDFAMREETRFVPMSQRSSLVFQPFPETLEMRSSLLKPCFLGIKPNLV